MMWKLEKALWGDVRKRVIERDGRDCYLCNTRCVPRKKNTSKDGRRLLDTLTVDHIIPVSRGGGRYAMDNLRVCCFGCNQLKSDSILEHFTAQMA